MLYSTEIPPKKPQLKKNTRTMWVMAALIVIIALAIFCLLRFDTAVMLAGWGT